MKALRLQHPQGIDALELVNLDDPGDPGPGEIRVALRASSLNYHDLAVVSGRIPTEAGRIPLSDGSGVVEAAGVIVISSSDEKLENARAPCADYTINYRQVESWAQTVLDPTGGRSTEYVIDVGGAGTLPQSIEACRIGGYIVLIGVLAKRSREIPTPNWRPQIDPVFPLEQTAEAIQCEMAANHFSNICVSI